MAAVLCPPPRLLPRAHQCRPPDQGLDSASAVELIRKERKGAINKKQLDFLRSYKPPPKSSCAIM